MVYADCLKVVVVSLGIYINTKYSIVSFIQFYSVGLAIHITAGFMQPGISNRQVLEIFNAGNVRFVNFSCKPSIDFMFSIHWSSYLACVFVSLFFCAWTAKRLITDVSKHKCCKMCCSFPFCRRSSSRNVSFLQLLKQ